MESGALDLEKYSRTVRETRLLQGSTQLVIPAVNLMAAPAVAAAVAVAVAVAAAVAAVAAAGDCGSGAGMTPI